MDTITMFWTVHSPKYPISSGRACNPFEDSQEMELFPKHHLSFYIIGKTVRCPMPKWRMSSATTTIWTSKNSQSSCCRRAIIDIESLATRLHGFLKARMEGTFVQQTVSTKSIYFDGKVPNCRAYLSRSHGRPEGQHAKLSCGSHMPISHETGLSVWRQYDKVHRKRTSSTKDAGAHDWTPRKLFDSQKKSTTGHIQNPNGMQGAISILMSPLKHM